MDREDWLDEDEAIVVAESFLDGGFARFLRTFPGDRATLAAVRPELFQVMFLLQRTEEPTDNYPVWTLYYERDYGDITVTPNEVTVEVHAETGDVRLDPRFHR
ncbi:MAG: hypothetical protein AAF125_04345 [Chloroflexota bacterium]